MTQQTTPRKTVERIARDAAEDYFNRWYDAEWTPGQPPRTLEYVIHQAISDAVKGSGAVEALQLVDLNFARTNASDNFDETCFMGDDDFEAWAATKKAREALRALTLPEQPTK